MSDASARSVTDEYRLQATWLASSHAAVSNFVLTNSRTHHVERRDDPRTLVFDHMKRCGTTSDEKQLSTLSLPSHEPKMIYLDKITLGRNLESILTFPVCGDCGSPLQPGWKGTHVVKLGRMQPRDGSSRTQTRRARRRRLEAKVRAQKDSSLPPPRPPAKNRFILQCGLCASRNSLPGNPKPKKPKYIRKQSDQKGKKQSSTMIKGRISAQPPKHKSTGTAQFVRLPEDSPRSLPSATKPATTLAAAGGKKKKVKKTNLMDFLSSLND